jgi:hypothetical protein
MACTMAPKAIDWGSMEAIGLGEAIIEPQQHIQQREHKR